MDKAANKFKQLIIIVYLFDILLHIKVIYLHLTLFNLSISLIRRIGFCCHIYKSINL